MINKEKVLKVTFKYIVTLLTVILLWINWYRYHTPFENYDISDFDYYAGVSYSLLTLIAILKPRNILTESLLVFTLLQAIESISDEITKMWHYIGQSDDNYLIFCIGFSIAFIITRYWLQKSILKRYLNQLPII